MPNWQIVVDAYARFVPVHRLLDSALVEAIETRNPEALPMLEVLVAEAQGLMNSLLGAFAAVRPTAPD